MRLVRLSSLAPRGFLEARPGLALVALAVLGFCGVGACRDRAQPDPTQDSRSDPLAASALALDTASPPHARDASAEPESTTGGNTAAAETSAAPPAEPSNVRFPPAPEQHAELLKLLERHGASPKALDAVRGVLAGSDALGFGNPEHSRPQLSREQCLERRTLVRPHPADPRCGAPHMVPVVEVTGGQSAANANVCIDQFEFPNVPCSYPVVWVRPHEARALCKAVGKRLCDAHEWEGACAGTPRPVAAEYAFDEAPRGSAQDQFRERRAHLKRTHDAAREVRWAYGEEKDHALCATDSFKGSNCTEVTFSSCGSNTYPSGSFPACVSPLGVYDLHGNVAEHMSLPLFREELGGEGWTEMKGSWFIFAREEAHPDDCRWRAKNWHPSRVAEADGHRSYHLGFRCCKDLPPRAQNR